jgi:predicted outer membrane protein
MASWKLPLIVSAIAVPIVAAFLVVGPALGMAAGALAAFALLVVAARQRPRGPIGMPAEDGPRRVLLVLACVAEDPAAVRRVATAAGLAGGNDGAEVLVLSPARIGFLDRWASDVEAARQSAQESLVATVAALAKAGIAAEARVGDEDVVQAVEDQLQSFQASDVVLVSDGEKAEAAAAAELEPRLRARFHHVVLGGR